MNEEERKIVHEMLKLAKSIGITDFSNILEGLKQWEEPKIKVVRIETQPLIFMEKK